MGGADRRLIWYGIAALADLRSAFAVLSGAPSDRIDDMNSYIRERRSPLTPLGAAHRLTEEYADHLQRLRGFRPKTYLGNRSGSIAVTPSVILDLLPTQEARLRIGSLKEPGDTSVVARTDTDKNEYCRSLDGINRFLSTPFDDVIERRAYFNMMSYLYKLSITGKGVSLVAENLPEQRLHMSLTNLEAAIAVSELGIDMKHVSIDEKSYTVPVLDMDLLADTVSSLASSFTGENHHDE